MSHLSSTPLIARAILLAGVLLAILTLLSPSHFPAYAQEMDGPIMYPENGTHTVAAYTAMDPEGEDITWSLSEDTNDSPDYGDFTIEGGVLTFRDGPPDYEDPKDDDTDNVYNVTVVASDSDANGKEEMVTLMVTVTDVEEDGEVTLDGLQPKQEVPITATLTDPDDSVADLTWKWERSRDGSTGWTDIATTTIVDGTPTTTTTIVDGTTTITISTTATAIEVTTIITTDGTSGDPTITTIATIGGGTATTATYRPVADDVGSYLRATATYKDGHGEDDPYTEDLDESEDTASMTSENPVLMADYENTAPVFPDQDPDMDGVQNTETDRSVMENSVPGTAIGAPVAATDIGADGSQEVLTYTLIGADASLFTINERTGQISVDTTLDYEDVSNTDHEYQVTVTATDPSGTANTTITVTIEVTNVDEDPTTPEGDTDIDYAETRTNEIATYTATDVEDEDADLEWSVSGSHGRYFNIGPNSGVLTFKSQPDYENPAGRSTVYTVTVVVTDSGGNTASLSVIVRLINVEEQGEVTLSNRQPEVGTSITARLTDTDKVSGSVTWEWAFGSDPVVTLTGGTSSTYRPLDSHLNDSLVVTAKYTDGHGANKEAESESAPGVQAKDSNDPDPMFPATETGARSIDEDQTGNVGDPVQADDDDTLTYTMSGGRDDEVFTINEENGQISVKSGTELDHETQATYSVQVTATDPSLDNDRITVTINVTNVEENPSITAGDTEIDYPENSTGAVETYRATDPEDDRASPRKQLTWSVTNPTIFSIEGGVLRFMSKPDYESLSTTVQNNGYPELTVTVMDSDNTDATRIVTVTVTNVDEDGEITLPTLKPKEEVEITATLTDPDGTISNTEWQWARSTNRTSWTDIEAAVEAGGVPAVTSNTMTYTPSMADVGKYLRATATYNDGESEDTTDTKTAEVISDNKVAMKDYLNTAPVFPDQDPETVDLETDQTREIYENMAPGTDVGEPVVATDIGVDGGQEILVYSLDDAGPFAIDRATGQISVGAGAELDYEDVDNTDHEYEVTVTATDPSGTASDAVTVTITVKDVQEAPKLAGLTANDDPTTPTTERDHPENTLIETERVTYTATDDEDDGADPRKPLKWSLSGADMDQFNLCDPSEINTCADPLINSPVELRFKDLPDFEDPADSGGNNVYNATVTVTDSRGRTDSVDVAVSVTNVEEDGEVTLSNRQPEVGVPIRAMLTDPDGGVRDVTWQWDYGDGSADIEDATTDTYTPVTTEATNNLKLRAKAKYRDAASENNPFTADDESLVILMGTDSPSVIAAVSNNQAPVFPDQDDDTPGDQSDRATRYVHENTKPNSAANPVDTDDPPNLAGNVGAPVAAMDSNTEHLDKLTYTLGGADVGAFTIDSGTGQIVVGEATELDYETKTSYTVRVTATDPSGASDTIIVTIMLRNVDEMPVISKSGLGITGDNNIDHDEDDTSDVATYTAAGQAAPGARWSLGGDDAGDFAISSSGVLTFRSTPDFENPTDQGANNVYSVMVKATSGAIEASLPVTVTVGNLEEVGTVTLSSNQDEVKVEVPITAEVTDLDVVIPNTVTWQWASSANAAGPWADIAGATSEAYTPVEANVGNYLQATARYEDGHSSGKSESAATASTVLALTTDVIGDNGVVTLSSNDPVMGQAVTASLTDSDSPLPGITWQWASSSTPNGPWTDIAGETSVSYTPVQADVGRYLQATASYEDAQGPNQTASETTNEVNAATTIPIHRFDSNRDGSIQRGEVLAVIREFLGVTPRTISRSDVLEVIRLHLSS